MLDDAMDLMHHGTVDARSREDIKSQRASRYWAAGRGTSGGACDSSEVPTDER
jgi:hypothetical protein